MGLCKNCRYGETRKGMLFTNYWCNKKNTMYYGNLSACNSYSPKGATCLSCVYFEEYESHCNRCDKVVNKSRAACNNYLAR